MKKVIIFWLSFVILLMVFCHSSSFPNPKEVNANADLLHEDAVIVLLLSPYIEDAINDFYGDQVTLDYKGQPSVRQTALYDAKIDSIVRIGDNFSYKISVTVPTFHGAHNPPYAEEVMTFVIRPIEKPTLVSYESYMM